MEQQTAVRNGTNGGLGATLSREIVRLHARSYGRGPTKARSVIGPGFAFCVLEDIFSTAERTLIANKGGAHVIENRRRLHEAGRGELEEIVERVTGRHVAAALSQVEIEANTGVEFFLLEDS
jgi:uncharacterized protein YbcI